LSLKRLIREYFGFSKTQTNGFLVMMPLMLLLLFVPVLYRDLTQHNYDKFETDQLKLDSLVALWKDGVRAPKDSITIELGDFDPNTASVEQMLKLGFGNGLSTRIEKYRNAGGQFRVKSDLKKIYGFPDSLYQSLIAYIMLPETIARATKVEKEKPRPNYNASKATSIESKPVGPNTFVLELNTADSLDFRKLKGIGPTYSRRIIKYREMLGGFTSIEQIAEVYGISDSLYQTLEPYLNISEGFEPIQLNINIATFKELNAHPYISFEQTKEIMTAKSKYGKFNDSNDLKKLSTFDSIQIAKLTPYLKFK